MHHRRQEWVEQPVHKEIGDAVAKLYTQARDAGGLARMLEREGAQCERVQVSD